MVQKMSNLILNWTYLLQLSSVQCSRCSSTYRFAGKPQKSAPSLQPPTQKTGAIVSYFSKELSISRTSLSPSLCKIKSQRDLLVIHSNLRKKQQKTIFGKKKELLNGRRRSFVAAIWKSNSVVSWWKKTWCWTVVQFGQGRFNFTEKVFQLKPSQNKKGQKNLQVHRFWCLFYSWQLRKRHQKTVHLEFFWPFLFWNSFRPKHKFFD